jgi:hypothetical protein
LDYGDNLLNDYPFILVAIHYSKPGRESQGPDFSGP